MSGLGTLQSLGYNPLAMAGNDILSGALSGYGTAVSNRIKSQEAGAEANLKNSQADYYSGRNGANMFGATTRADATKSAADIRAGAMQAVAGMKAEQLQKYGVTQQETKLLQTFLNPDNSGAFDQPTMDAVGGVVQKILRGRMNDTFAPDTGASQGSPPEYTPLVGGPAPTVAGQPAPPATSPADTAPAPAPVVSLPSAPAVMPAPAPVAAAPNIPTSPVTSPRFAMPPNPLALPITRGNLAPTNSPQGQLLQQAYAQSPAATLRQTGSPGQSFSPSLASFAPPPTMTAAAPPSLPPAPSTPAPNIPAPPALAAAPAGPAASPGAPVSPLAAQGGAPYGQGNGFVVRPGIKQTTAQERVQATKDRTTYLTNDSTVKAMNALDKEYTDAGMSDQMYLAALGRIAPDMVSQIAKIDPATGRVHMLIQPGKLMQSLIQERQTNGSVKLFLAPSEAARNYGQGAAAMANAAAIPEKVKIDAQHIQNETNKTPAEIENLGARTAQTKALTDLAGQKFQWNPRIWGNDIATSDGHLDVSKIATQGGIQHMLWRANQPSINPADGKPILGDDGKPVTPASLDPTGYANLQSFANQAMNELNAPGVTPSP